MSVLHHIQTSRWVDPRDLAWIEGAYAAWMPKHAVSSADGRRDLTGNGRHLVGGGAPAWNYETGYSSTTYAAFDKSADLMVFTAVWYGRLAQINSPPCWHNDTGWSGFVMHSTSTGVIYAGCNANQTPCFVLSAPMSTDVVIFFQKRADYSQRLLINLGEVSGSPNAGTAQLIDDIKLGINQRLYAAGLWTSALTNEQMTAIYNSLVG